MIKNREFQTVARLAWANAKRAGLIAIPDRCERCGVAGPVDGHHTDYLLPFSVEWLCRRCHKGAHRETDAFLRSQRQAPEIGSVNMIDATPCAHCRGSGWLAKPLPLTPTQRKLYEYVWSHTAVKGYAPSFTEIAKTFGYTTLATVHEHLSNLEKKYWIARRFNDARAITCLVDLSKSEVAA